MSRVRGAAVSEPRRKVFIDSPCRVSRLLQMLRTADLWGTRLPDRAAKVSLIGLLRDTDIEVG